MPKLFDALPFLTKGSRTTSTKGYPLQQFWELRFGGTPAHGVGARAPAPLKDPRNRPVEIKSHQIFTWVALGFRGGTKSDACFPVMVDTGCSQTLVASEWYLQHWANSAAFDFQSCRVVDLVEETVASTPVRTGPAAPPPSQLIANKPRLHTIWHHWQDPAMKKWLPVLEADLWLSANEPGERDELRDPNAWYRLGVGTILVRHGATARPPLLGLRALQFKNLDVNRTVCRLDRLEIDLEQSSINLSYH